jgi:NAD(P)H-dependent flavin oxidoreductase YrpB (nitropropane dioxygenase family)
VRTALTERLGIELPIVQAPMGGATTPELVAAVSNAGGLGLHALSWHPPEAVRAVIRATRALTDKPFGVNLVLAFPQDARLAVCLEEKVPVISFFWGDPAPHAEACHAAGAAVLSTVASADQARAAVAAGADVVVAQGWEAGGHVLGEVATLPLTRAVADAVAPTPVVAAGGIVDGRGLAAALALGAAGAWIGTRFLATPEAAIHPDYRARLIAAAETATVHTRLFDVGWPNAPHRVLRNSTVAAWEAAGRPASGARPGEGEAVAQSGRGPIPRYASATPGPDAQGDIEALSLWAGQGVAGVGEVKPAAEVVAEIAGEARAVLKSLAAELGL